MEEHSLKQCNFCGRSEEVTNSMFSAGNVNICDRCVCYCYDMLESNGLTAEYRAEKESKKSKEAEKYETFKTC